MGGRNRNPFRGKQRGFDAGKAPRGLPKGRKGAKPVDDGSGPRRRRAPGGAWGLVGLVGAFAALWLGSFARFAQQRRKAAGGDARLLRALAARPLQFTEHALCRMDCRHITEDEIDQVLATGSVNRRKSDPRLLPCPKYVVDAQVGAPRKNVQAVFSACPLRTDVVTVIDRDTKWPCYCPGDD